MPIRILIVGHYRLVREGLRVLIESRRQMCVIGLADYGEEALIIASREQPEIILLNLDFWDGSGLDFLPKLRAAARATRVIVLAGVCDSEQKHKAVTLGAMGLVHKDQSGEVFLSAIEKVHAGEAWFDRKTAAYAISSLSQLPMKDEDAGKIVTLTAREREINALICQGLKNKEIGERLFISEGTVRNHLTSMLRKLGLYDRFELALFSYRHGLAKPPHQ